MTQEQNRPVSPNQLFREELIGCSHELQTINSCLDVLWRATCHDAHHGGYPEFVAHIRKQIGPISDRLQSLAGSLPSLKVPIQPDLNGAETTPQTEDPPATSS